MSGSIMHPKRPAPADGCVWSFGVSRTGAHDSLPLLVEALEASIAAAAEVLIGDLSLQLP
jgi:hypothetical protein